MVEVSAFQKTIYMRDNLGEITWVDAMPHPNFGSADLRIVEAARISTNMQSKGEFQDARLINYLMKNRHTSPFEMVELTFLVKAPIFVARQWMRHRTWNFNEVSRRYTADNIEIWIPPVLTLQSNSNHQGRSDAQLETDSESQYLSQFQSHALSSMRLYESMIESGVARETARTVLPLGLQTKFFAKVDLHNLFHFIELRLDQHAQHEIRLYAYAIFRILETYAPIATSAFRQFRFDPLKQIEQPDESDIIAATEILDNQREDFSFIDNQNLS